MADAPAPLLVARPLLPTVDQITPYLRRIDDSRWYTNGGLLLREFEARLARHFTAAGEEEAHVAVVGSATTGLTLCLMAMAGERGGACLMPSWTFLASACAVLAGGLEPHFMDAGATGWMPDLARADAEMAAQGNRIAALMLVPPAGTRTSLQAWEARAAGHAVPLIIDAADGFDMVVPCRTPQVLSLHATKAFGIGEGGCVVSTDATLIAKIRQLANFGIGANRIADEPGINGKLSEYAAAIGLAALDVWPETRARWRDRAETYRKKLATAGYTLLFHDDLVSSTALIDLGAPDAVAVAERMWAEKVEARRWWGSGCHRHPAFARYATGPQPGTDDLAGRILGLPFHVDLPDVEMDRVIALLGKARAG